MSNIVVRPWNRRLLKSEDADRTIAMSDIKSAEAGKVFDGTEHKPGTYILLRSGEQIITNDPQDLKKIDASLIPTIVRKSEQPGKSGTPASTPRPAGS